MSLADIGINLMHPSFDKDREQVIENAYNAGVKTLIITGTNVKASLEAHAYITQNQTSLCKLFFTAGIHPHEASGCDDSAIIALRDIANKGAIAIGECGLDYCRDYSPRSVQRNCFEKQLELAVELKLPLFLHEREAHEDFRDILRNIMREIPGAVVHCFTGNEAELECYLDMGCYIGITGWICDERRGQHLAALVKKIPANRLLIETDAPFLAPRNLPGKKLHRNEPKYLPHIVEVIVHHQNKEPSLLAEETYTNTFDFFRLSK